MDVHCLTLYVKICRLRSKRPLHGAGDAPVLRAADVMDGERHTTAVTGRAESGRVVFVRCHVPFVSDSEDLILSDTPGHDLPFSHHSGVERHVRTLQHCFTRWLQNKRLWHHWIGKRQRVRLRYERWRRNRETSLDFVVVTWASLFQEDAQLWVQFGLNKPFALMSIWSSRHCLCQGGYVCLLVGRLLFFAIRITKD